jgi:hypothetical protein
LDWHILGGFVSLLVNWRVAERLGEAIRTPHPEWNRTFQELVFSVETPDMEEAPIGGISIEQLRLSMQTNALSTLKAFGLSPRQQTPNFEGLLRFLRIKARFFDDIDHDDPFDLCASA